MPLFSFNSVSLVFRLSTSILLLFQVFRECLFSLQRDNFLREVDSDRLFSNIQDIYNTNRIFWSEYLRHVVAETKRTREPIKPSQLLDSFARVSQVLFGKLFNKFQKSNLQVIEINGSLKGLLRVS